MGAFRSVDEVKRGNAVLFLTLDQVVQSLEGGSSTRFCPGGAIVQQGQPLIRINDIKFASEFGEIASGAAPWLRGCAT